MFKQNVENQCMQEMHATTARLFEALKKVADIDAVKEPGAAAVRLGENSGAVLTNWRARGVSQPGMLNACLKLGLRPLWLADGKGEMLIDSKVPPAPTIEQALHVFVDALMAAKQRKQAYAQLGVLMEGDSPLMRQTLLALLTEANSQEAA